MQVPWRYQGRSDAARCNNRPSGCEHFGKTDDRGIPQEAKSSPSDLSFLSPGLPLSSARTLSTAAQDVPPQPPVSMARTPAPQHRRAVAAEIPQPVSLTMTGFLNSAGRVPRWPQSSRSHYGRLPAGSLPAGNSGGSQSHPPRSSQRPAPPIRSRGRGAGLHRDLLPGMHGVLRSGPPRTYRQGTGSQAQPAGSRRPFRSHTVLQPVQAGHSYPLVPG
jgi:hypothetical protein